MLDMKLSTYFDRIALMVAEYGPEKVRFAYLIVKSRLRKEGRFSEDIIDVAAARLFAASTIGAEIQRQIEDLKQAGVFKVESDVSFVDLDAILIAEMSRQLSILPERRSYLYNLAYAPRDPRRLSDTANAARPAMGQPMPYFSTNECPGMDRIKPLESPKALE